MTAKEEYLAKLRDPRWQKMRLQVLERDEWMCRRCYDSKSTLHVHHRWYLGQREPWDYPLAALVTLCEDCHATEGELTANCTHDLPQIIKQAGAMGYEFQELCSAFLDASTPLNEYDWEVLAFAISRLLCSREGSNDADSDLWMKAVENYRTFCSQVAAQKRTDKGSA